MVKRVIRIDRGGDTIEVKVIREPTADTNDMTLIATDRGKSFFISESEEKSRLEGKLRIYYYPAVIYNVGDIVKRNEDGERYKLLYPSSGFDQPVWTLKHCENNGTYSVYESGFTKVEEPEFEVGDYVTSKEDNYATVWKIKSIYSNGKSAGLEEYQGEDYRDDRVNRLTKIDGPKFEIGEAVNFKLGGAVSLDQVAHHVKSLNYLHGEWEYEFCISSAYTVLVKESELVKWS